MGPQQKSSKATFDLLRDRLLRSLWPSACFHSICLLCWRHHCKSLSDVHIFVFLSVCAYTEM